MNSPALPVAHLVLRTLIVLNWLSAAAMLPLTIATFVDGQWVATMFHVPLSSRPMMGIRAVMALGILIFPLNHSILRRLMAIVETVRRGDPFVAANAVRLKAIAWVLLALQVLSILIGWVNDAAFPPDYCVHLDAGFSASGWLAVFMTFILARVFAAGARMRDDLQGTV